MLKFLTLTLMLAVGCKAQVLYECPSGWLEYEKHCYHFVFYPHHGFREATSACQIDGAYLVSINTALEFEFVSARLTSSDQNKANKWWTSGQGFGSDMTWGGDGRPVLSSPDQWANSGDMNSAENGQHIVFVFTVLTGRFMYGRQTADIPSPYVCEIPMEEAYRIVQKQRDHMFGTNITDPNNVVLGPKFLTQPVSIIVLAPLDKAEIECIAHSNPSATYAWFKSQDSGAALTKMTGSQWTTITNGKLTLHQPQERRDEGQYQCLATNTFGSILSDPVRVSFGYIKEFSNDPPGSVSAKLYQGTVLNCQLPSYNPAVSIKWYKEDDGPNFMRTDLHPYIFQSNNGKLYFSETSEMDAGYYHCFVTLMSPVGQILSSSQFPSRTSLGTKLIITGDMAIDYGPEMHNDFPAVFPYPSLRGENLVIECFAYGKLPLYYSWYRDNGPIPAKSSLIDHGRQLLLPNAQVEDGGTYTCRVERGGSALQEKTLRLVIEARPYFIFPLTDQHVDIGRQLTWRCEALAFPKPTYTWFKNGQELTSVPGDVEVHVNTLTIYQADPEKHPGMYQCRAANVHGVRFSSAQLRVLSFAPSFIKNPLNPSQMGTEGGSVTILCQPEASPAATVTWSKDDQLLPVSEEGNGRISQLANGNLLIKDLQKSDQGVYKCTATNDVGTASSSGRLHVVEKTIISIPPIDVRADVNSTAFLSCQASYDQTSKDLVYVWDLNGRVIDFTREPHYMLSSTESLSGLYIVSAQIFHTGRYTCSATTVDDAVKASAYVTVNGPPGECAGVRAVISGRMATIAWILAPNHGSPISSFLVQFNTNFNSEWRTLRKDVSIRDVVDATTTRVERCVLEVDDLKPGSSYRFRVVAFNRYGPGPPSLPSVLYKVPDAAPVVAVEEIRAGWGPVGTLSIVWNHLSEEDLTGDGVGYQVYYRRKMETQTQWSQKTVLGRKNTVVPTVGALNYYLPYEVMVSAFNSLGHGPNSTIAVIMSAEDMAVAAPSRVYGIAHNATAMWVYWTPIPNTREYVRGKTMGYQINYWSQTQIEPELGTDDIYCDCGYALLVALDPNERYWLNVKIFTSAGFGPLSGVGEGRTYIFPPRLYPEYVQVTSHIGNSVFVTWRGVSTGLLEEPIIGYKIWWWPATENIKTANSTVVPWKMLSGVVKGIEPGTVYALRVLAYSSGGDGSKSPTTYFTLEGQVIYNPETTEIMNQAPQIISSFFISCIISLYLSCLLTKC